MSTSAGHEAPWAGAGLALVAAALFGASTPLAKLLLGEIAPWTLAGLLYLGAGLGLLLYRAGRRIGRGLTGRPAGAAAEAALHGRQWLWLTAAILCGGVVGPVCLMFGLARTPASAAALLLNLEAVFTALAAWFLFRENFDRRIAGGMLAIVAGAALLAWDGGVRLDGLAGPLLIAAACLAWALDNNLTRKVALSDPVQIAICKGLVAGAINLALALAAGAALPAPAPALAAGVLGLFGYGISLALFVTALRQLGAARTGAYFSVAPFFGAALALPLLGEPLGPRLALVAALMALGVWLHLTERHVHEHEHAPLTHAHRHVHDAHHRHAHGPDDPQGEPHSHQHSHVRLRHRHAHYPDSHHRHRH